jgi:hypothetical protein
MITNTTFKNATASIAGGNSYMAAVYSTKQSVCHREYTNGNVSKNRQGM